MISEWLISFSTFAPAFAPALYVNVYNHSKLKQKRNEVENIITKLFDYYLKNFDKLPKDWSIQKKEESENRIICDYISGMTDRYATKLYKSIYEWLYKYFKKWLIIFNWYFN